MGKLEGKVALVTGGNSGIGLATAKELVGEGAYVYITGRRQAELDAAVAAIGNGVTAVNADSSKLDDLDEVYSVLQRDHRKLDILFANAGGGTFAPIGNITEEDFDATFDTNVKGVLFTVQKALPHFNDGGSIILNASIAASKGIPGLSVYSASKAALRSFSRVWMMDLRERRIRVNTISPGPVDTPSFRAAGGADVVSQQNFIDSQAAQVPSGRVGLPVDIARAVVFLGSEDSAFVNGIELFVDGGIAQN